MRGGTTRMTAAQALVRYLAAQRAEDGRPLFAGVWAIFGHGNVAGLGHALHEVQDVLPILRAHNEQAMGHAAVAYAKAQRRRRMMACTTSIGPGATNLVTAAATAHVNRLPVLLLPGDVFASRVPDPVLQQLELPGEPGATVNDCLRPVSRYFDRLHRPEQLLASLPQALRVLTDPAECGPVTLALPQDVQTEAFEYPDAFFAPTTHRLRRPPPDPRELQDALRLLRGARRPLLVAGGGVLYAEAEAELAALAHAGGIPVAFTQAGNGALGADDPAWVGGLGVTGSAAANDLARDADLVLAVGTRLSDFTTASRTLFPQARLLSVNVAAFDAVKQGGLPVVGDAQVVLEAMIEGLRGWRADPAWSARAAQLRAAWRVTVARVTAPGPGLPTDAQVLGAVADVAGPDSVVVGAAGGLPGELHKLWRPAGPGSYHLEYGYSCMGYELAGGLGVKLACPEREVFVLVGDGSYLMMNSELATSVALGQKLVVVLLDNRGFGCIHRLQASTGGPELNNLRAGEPAVDLAAHARALGAEAERVPDLASLPAALARARAAAKTAVVVIETDPGRSTAEGGAWWDVAVPETSPRPEVMQARLRYERARSGGG
jgi:3D-(3,5/4)-trihydroxycyclohexane-1,2-dione acylhydrolase (decyclizing)